MRCLLPHCETLYLKKKRRLFYTVKPSSSAEQNKRKILGIRRMKERVRDKQDKQKRILDIRPMQQELELELVEDLRSEFWS